MIIAVDFDGTCVEHMYPVVGPDVPGAVDALRMFVERGDQLILWTMRSDDTLSDARVWFAVRNIPLLGANVNPQQKSWSQSPKAYAHLYIDDAALGCPLIPGTVLPGDMLGSNRPMVDWPSVLVLMGLS